MLNTTVSEWKGFTRHDFTLDGRFGIVVEPKIAQPSRPWVWRAEFFDVFSTADMALLEQGWHLAYYHVSDMYGCPKAVELMDRFHNEICSHFTLNAKADIFGFSRGGLYTVNYAAAHPQNVSSVYLDAAVLNINSWPGGDKKTVFFKEWAECLSCYGIIEETAPLFRGNPLDKIDILIKNNIPVFIVAGDSDGTVEFNANSVPFYNEYKAKGGHIEMIVKKGCDHHPHSLEDPKPIVDFIKQVHSIK